MTLKSSLQPFFVGEIHVLQHEGLKGIIGTSPPGFVQLSLLQHEIKQIIRPLKNDVLTA
jgi:hypothetical protein